MTTKTQENTPTVVPVTIDTETREATGLPVTFAAGPWSVVECSGFHEFMVTSDEWTVAELCGERARAEANARLIAASPALLDRGHALAMLVLQSDEYAERSDWRDAVDNLLAVIREAEGR